MLATADYKNSAEIAVHSGRATLASDLDAGAFGIPAANSGIISQFVASVTIENGIITAVSQNLGNDSSYTLTATIANNGIRWVEGGACIPEGLC